MGNGSKLLVTLNLLGAVASLLLLLSTWFTKGIIIRHAQDIALEKTRSYLAPVIPAAEKLLKQPLLTKAIPPALTGKIEKEIANYQESPDAWLLGIAAGTRARAKEFDFPEVKNPLARKSLDFLTHRLTGARKHFKKSFDNLMRDLRIFSGTNLTVFLIAAGLCFTARTPQSRRWLAVWSALLLTTTILSIFLYAGQGWAWNILTNRYPGWAYPVAHLLFTVCLAARLSLNPGTFSHKTETDKPCVS